MRVFFLRRFFIASLFVSSSESIGGDLELPYSGSGDSSESENIEQLDKHIVNIIHTTQQKIYMTLHDIKYTTIVNRHIHKKISQSWQKDGQILPMNY